MSFIKIARGDILDVRYSKRALRRLTAEGFERLAKPTGISDDGFLYARVRAISSRVNKNNDGWPSQELAKAYPTFEGRPVFVDHNNDDPGRARGVVLWSKLHVDDEKTSALDPYYANAPDNHLPPTWIELMLEVDAHSFPKLADALVKGDIDAVSMGANIDTSICSVCQNAAVNPQQYCSHIKSKGSEFEVTSADGSRTRKKAYEDCHGLSFFEISFVFDPADETALIEDTRLTKAARVAAPSMIHHDLENRGGSPEPVPQRERNYKPQFEQMTAPQQVDTLRDEHVCPDCGTDMKEPNPGIWSCPECGFGQPPEGVDNPDLSQARHQDFADEQEAINNPEQPPGETMGVSPIPSVRPMARKAKPSKRLISDMNWTVKIKTTKVRDNSEVVAFLSGLLKSSTKTYMDERELQREAASLGHKVTRWDAAEAIEMNIRTAEGWDNQHNYGQGESDYYTKPNQSLYYEKGMTAPAEPQSGEAQSPEEENWGTQMKHQQGSEDQYGADRHLPPERKPPSLTSATKKVILKGKGKASAEPQDQKIVSDQLTPVESNKETDMKTADRETIKRIEEDGQGIKRTEEITKEYGPLTDSYDEEFNDEAEAEIEQPEATEVQPGMTVEPTPAPAMASVSPEQKLMIALRTAKLAASIGLIDGDDDLLFAAELEDESLAEIEAGMRMLQRVKEAGLSKAKIRPALAHRFPSTKTASQNGNSADDVPDEALFL